jgi:phage terminase large subunit GpA-like protein
VSWQEIYGDISDLSPSGPWHQLDNILKTDYVRDDGIPLKIKAMAVDTGGHFTHETYMYCRSRKRLGVIAIKGSSLSGKPALGKSSKQDVNYKGQVFKNGVELWNIGTDTIKSTIYSRLKRPMGQGQATFHFPAGLPADYFNQLTAEKQITRYRNGFAMRIWTKKDGVRNEALDCEVYAYAGLQHLYTRYDRNTIWLQAQQIIDRLTPEKEVVKPWNDIDYQEEVDSESVMTTPVTLPSHPPPVRRPMVRRNTGFVNGWR